MTKQMRWPTVPALLSLLLVAVPAHAGGPDGAAPACCRPDGAVACAAKTAASGASQETDLAIAHSLDPSTGFVTFVTVPRGTQVPCDDRLAASRAGRAARR